MSIRSPRNVSTAPLVHPLYGAVLAAAAALGCAGMFQSQSTSGPSEPESLSGTVTFVNQSSHRVCGIEYHGEPEFGMAVNLGTGDSTTFDIEDGGKMILIECDQPYTLWGDMGGVGIPGQQVYPVTSLRWVLYDAGQAPANPSGEIALEVTRRPFSEWIPTQGRAPRVNDPALAQAFLQTVTQHAASRGWRETFLLAGVQGQDWTIGRNDLTGIVTHRDRNAMVVSRWPEGWCRLIESNFRQQHDGSSFSGPYAYHHGAFNWAFPCAAVSEFGVAPSGGASAPATVAPSAPAVGGRCENTCRTSNDGECDDGGPNSLYSICALGTDCNDCGPR